MIALHRHETALLAHGNLEPDDYKNVQEYSQNLSRAIKRCYQPWIKEKTVEELGAELAQRWINHYGDPEEPDTKRRIDKTLAWFEEMDAKYGD